MKNLIISVVVLMLVMFTVKGRVTMAETEGLTQKIFRYAKMFSVDPALFLGLIKWESGFDVDAEAKEGPDPEDYSVGLCQVLLTTAYSMGYKNTGNPVADRERLKDPDTNLYYGARYLSRKLKQYYMYPLYIQVAAYNSGAPIFNYQPGFEGYITEGVFKRTWNKAHTQEILIMQDKYIGRFMEVDKLTLYNKQYPDNVLKYYEDYKKIFTVPEFSFAKNFTLAVLISGMAIWLDVKFAKG